MFCYVFNLTSVVQSCNNFLAACSNLYAHHLTIASPCILQEISKSVYQPNPSYSKLSIISEDIKIQYFQDDLTDYFYCDLVPEQSAKKFQNKCGKISSPVYFERWRSPWGEFGIASEKVTVWVAGGAR